MTTKRITARIMVRETGTTEDPWPLHTGNAQDPRLAERVRKYQAQDDVEVLGIEIHGHLYGVEEALTMQAEWLASDTV